MTWRKESLTWDDGSVSAVKLGGSTGGGQVTPPKPAAAGATEYGGAMVRRQAPSVTDTVLGAGSQFRGRLDLQGRAQIDGTIEGEIVVEGELHVGPTAVIKANILATRAVIAGRLTGDVRCEERLELRGGAYVTGDIAAPQVVMDDGVVFDGRCWMEQPDEELP